MSDLPRESRSGERYRLSPTAALVYLFIGQFLRENGYPPTLREIGREMGFRSTNGTRYFLGILVREKLIERDPKVTRGLRLVYPGRSGGQQSPP